MTADTPALRKARGAFFTPPELAEFITTWAVRDADDQVLEPSAGEASFLLAAGERLRELGREPEAGQLVGAELHAGSAVQAHELLAERGLTAHIEVGDFLSKPARPFAAAVVGNPPYVRYQDHAGAARTAGQQAALAAGVRLSGLASAWAPFVIHAAGFLREGGRLGLVLPGELLSVGYASEVRDFLLRRFGDVRLVMFEERVFPGVLEEVVLLLAEGQGPTTHIKLFQAQNAATLADAADVTWVRATQAADAKWTPALLDASSFEVYREAVASSSFATLSSAWGKASLGAVTGNNRWFALSEAEAHELGLEEDELVPISPPGSTHLRNLSFTSTQREQLGRDGRPIWLFYPSDPLSAAARARIASGEDDSVHAAYKCRVRSDWWRVPLAGRPHLLLTYMNHLAPQLTANRAGAYHLNSVHGVTLKDGKVRLGMDLLPMAALNSVTLLGGEMVGRAYGGGMLKLEPSEADRLPLPTPQLVEEVADELRALRGRVTRRLGRGDVLAAADLVDDVLLPAAGISVAERAALRAGWRLLFERREARGRS